MTLQAEPGAPGESNNELNPPGEAETAVLSAVWLAGPHPAALAEIEVAEDVEPQTQAPTRV